MTRVGRFEKVSLGQFNDSVRKEFSFTEKEVLQFYQDLELPVRATGGSAGYDFHAPFSFSIASGESIKIPTGVRVLMTNGWLLGCFPRSGLGFKYSLKLANTIGVVDSDYVLSDNEGHIFFKLENRGDRIVVINKGDKFAQGIFIPFGITYDDNVVSKRNGGFGSTDKQV